MTIKKKTSTIDTSKAETGTTEEFSRERPKRRKVYQRVEASGIPKEVIAKFAEDGYELRFVRWAVKGEVDYRSLNRREQEGYEFVKADELPKSYLHTMRVRDTGSVNGLVTNGEDVCLMKIDSDLRKSRQAFYAQRSQDEQDAVNINVLEKKGILRNTGTRSKVVLREPSFQD